MSWSTRAETRFLAESPGATTLPEARAEWIYTGRVKDHGEPSQDCQACGQTLRFAFLLRHARSRTRLWVGRECLQHLGIDEASPAGEGEDADDLRARMRADQREAEREERFRQVIQLLQGIREKDPSFQADGLIFHYRERRGFTPAQVRLIDWRAGKLGIDVPDSLLRIRLRKGREREQIQTMPWWQYRSIRRYLSPSQEKACRRLRARHYREKQEAS